MINQQIFWQKSDEEIENSNTVDGMIGWMNLRNLHKVVAVVSKEWGLHSLE